MKKINIAAPFDYRWPSGAITAFVPAERASVKDEVASYAIAKGFATAVRERKPASDAAPTDHRTNDPVDESDLADDGGADAGGAVDPPAGER